MAWSCLRLLVVLVTVFLAFAPAGHCADDLPGWVKGEGIPVNVRGSADGSRAARGQRHADQFLHVKTVRPADNMFPVVPHPEQDARAREKLAERWAMTPR